MNSKQFIPPDYSELMAEEELPFDSDLSGEDDEDLEEELESDDCEEKEKFVEQLEVEKKMTSPFNFGPSESQKPYNWEGWSPQPKPQTNNMWGGGNTGWWETGNNSGNTWGTVNRDPQKNSPINRDKKIIFIDFFDGMMETYQSQGQPGFLPRAVYDLKPRFEVWSKIAAFSPDMVFGIAQKEFLNDINGIEGWSKVLDGWCCCLSSFLRKQYGCVQILLSTSIYQPKDWVMSTAISNFKKDDCIYIGLQSGLFNQSNQDLVTAQKCGIDYVDLNQLLNNMY